MIWRLHPETLRYALALWLATVLALVTSFFLQIEPAQWAAVTVWTVFMQNPRMNYSKMLWWGLGTLIGAAMAVLLTVCFNQAPEVFLLFLSLWVAGCASIAPLVSSFRAYGAVLAGFTCAIISLATIDHPDHIFPLVISRVSCIFIGMASAVVTMSVLLPRHQHWRETLHHLEEHLRSALLQTAKALHPHPAAPSPFIWRQMLDRLSTVENTLRITTAETADSRARAPQARSLVAALFNLLARAQAVEAHLTRADAGTPVDPLAALLRRTQVLLETFAATLAATSSQTWTPQLVNQLRSLRLEAAALRQNASKLEAGARLSDRFLTDRLEEMLQDLEGAAQDWSGLFGPWHSKRPSSLAVHRDYPSALVHGLRMFLTMSLAGAFWFLTEWPSAPQFILFVSVACSLLSLLPRAIDLGYPFIKRAAFCAIAAFVIAFWLLPKGEGFLFLALTLGLFLLPAAYIWRQPRPLVTGVVSMLVFYGLTLPANSMNYDIATFLNNAVALLAATGCSFFAFHAVPALSLKARRFWLLRAARRDLAGYGRGRDGLSEQRWTSLMFDRLRLLHRTAGEPSLAASLPEAETELLVNLQLGLRWLSLRALLRADQFSPATAQVVADSLREFRKFLRRPESLAPFWQTACVRLKEAGGSTSNPSEPHAAALAELREMILLLQTAARFHAK